MSRSGQLPTPQQLDNMKDDLTFKEKEMEKAQATATGLNSGGIIIFSRQIAIYHNGKLGKEGKSFL